MNNDDRILELPQPIIDRLREVISRIRRMQWIKGSLLTLAAAVAAVLLVMALDAAFSLESVALRLALSLTALSATGWVAWSYWVRPLSRRISLTAVARWVESRHPELQERISTAVELLGSRHAADQGSRELLAAVVQDAVADVGSLDIAQDLSPRRTRPAKWLAGTAVAVLALITAIWPSRIPRLLARAVAPMAEVGNAWADRLRVLTPSQTLAIGDPLTIQVALSGGTERVELHLIGADGRPVVEMLLPDQAVPVESGENGYALRIPSVAAGFTARVIAGKATSAPFTITALPRPESGPWTLTYQYPEYTGLPDEIKTGASGEIAALAGTKVTARSTLNRPAAKAAVTIGDTAVPEVRLGSDPAAPEVVWSTVLTTGLEALWALRLEDENGLTNRPVELPIRSLPDLPPFITLEKPVEDKLELRPTEQLPLTYSLKEDIGLSAVRIRIRPQDKPEFLLPPSPMPDKSPDTADEYRGTAMLDLGRIMIPDGQEIRVSLMAADRLPPELNGPQQHFSREITIQLKRWAKPLVERNFEEQKDELHQKMEEVKRELHAAKGRMNDKPDRLSHEDRLSESTLQDLEAGTEHLRQAEALLNELTERMKETAYARQTPAMDQINQQMITPAKADTQEIPLTDEKQARAELARNSKDLLENAIREIESQQRQMDQSHEAVQQAAKLADIADQQQRLAAQAAMAEQAAASPLESSAPPNTEAQTTQTGQEDSSKSPAPAGVAEAPAAPTAEEQKRWLEEQRQVAKRAQELMEQNKNANPQATQEQMKQAAAQAAALAAEADTLAKQESQLAGEIASAMTPETMREAASAQQQLAEKITALQERAGSFQEQSTREINQSTETQSAAFEAQSRLEEAARLAQEAQSAMSAAAQEKAASTDASGEKPESGTSAKDPVTTGQDAAKSHPELAAQEASGKAQGSAPQTSGLPPEPDPASGENSNTPQTADSSGPTPAAKGQQAAQASSEAMAQAAESLKSLGAELHALAGILADHSNSLDQGAQQAGTAAEQAAAQDEQNKGPSMRQGAKAAQQAADELAMAANTMMQAMSIPASAKSSQANSASKGKGKPIDGQPQPSQPGQEGQGGMQMDTASSALPAELAKLGLTQDDWMKLKSTLNGVDGAPGEQVPAEYRDLVKAYFGAISKGNPAK